MSILPQFSVVAAGSRSNSPPRLITRGAQPPDVAAIPRPSSSLGGRIRQPTHRVAHSQGNSRDASPSRRNEPSGGRGNIIRRASDLEAAVADAWVSVVTVLLYIEPSQWCSMDTIASELIIDLSKQRELV